MEIDEKDLDIIKLLQYNSRITSRQIYRKTKIPITTIHNRIKKLEKYGIIKNFTVNLDYKKLGQPILVYVLITINYTLPSGEKTTQEDVAKQVRKYSNIEEVNIVTGGVDMLIKARFKDIDELYDFISTKLRTIDGIDKSQTLIALKSVNHH
ncbi:Lrp/AsnC family transcriptional regulator [Candidatus Woesearchaeota archaeon]|nr:Lrp/AsnC family transcriptional regulator [Candidatus Woesearchaeota archaeon]